MGFLDSLQKITSIWCQITLNSYGILWYMCSYYPGPSIWSPSLVCWMCEYVNSQKRVGEWIHCSSRGDGQFTWTCNKGVFQGPINNSRRIWKWVFPSHYHWSKTFTFFILNLTKSTCCQDFVWLLKYYKDSINISHFFMTISKK